MASPQVEEGCLSIAQSLVIALCQADVTVAQLQMLLVVMNLTYSVGLTKAEITVDDIRYQMGGDMRPWRAKKVFDELQEAHMVVIDNGKIGIQKDYEKWLDKATRKSLPHKSYIYNTKTTSAEKISVPKLLVQYTYSKSNLKVTGFKQLGIEERNARQLYTKAVSHLRIPANALLLVKDYLDYQLGREWVQTNVKMKLTFANGRFDAWLKQVPKKPRRVLDDEQITGVRHRYNVDKRKWEAADDKSATKLA